MANIREEFIKKGKDSGKKWITSMKAFKSDPIGRYKAGIIRREEIIERRKDLNKADRLAIKHLKVLIKKEEKKKNE